jgi:hypothetical protein
MGFWAIMYYLPCEVIYENCYFTKLAKVALKEQIKKLHFQKIPTTKAAT